jgi:chloramphenicol O-acetyltransferase type A
MRQIDIQTWERREHFNLFRTFDHPHFNMCANMDLTKFYPAVKARGLSFTVALVYILTRAANAIPEFRLRIRGEEVVEYDIVHPSITILVDEDRFSFCTFDYAEDFKLFAANAEEMIACVKENLTLEDPPDRNKLLFMSAIPWVSFTSFMHPIHLDPADSIPRFAWGKTFEEGDSLKMPLSVQAHHALMDGVHMGRYYIQVQEGFDQFDKVLGDG